MDPLDYRYVFRGRPRTYAPGVIRLQRAVPYLSQQIGRLGQQLESLETKGLGDAQFTIVRAVDQLMPICLMSGDPFLVERVGEQLMRLRGLNSRSPRIDVIQNIKELLQELEAYEPFEQAGGTENLLAAQGSEKDGKKASPADLAAEGSVFVIMPFSQDFNDVWAGGIQTAAKNAGFHPIRVDTIARSTNITDDIVESIKNCRISIVDVTGNNPNVMFELGYVMALEKPYVIISQSVDFLPFDIRNIRTIVYSNTWSGIETLRSRLNDFLKESSTTSRAPRAKKAAK